MYSLGYILKLCYLLITTTHWQHLGRKIRHLSFFSSGQTGIRTGTEVEAQMERVDVSEVGPARDREVVMGRRTTSGKGNGRLAGATVLRARAGSTTTAAAAAAAATTTTTTTSTTTPPTWRTGGVVNLLIGLCRTSLSSVTSTTAK